jgi:hypothetical protein
LATACGACPRAGTTGNQQFIITRSITVNGTHLSQMLIGFAMFGVAFLIGLAQVRAAQAGESASSVR